uniref:Uncharacterized protein n=1 Tax=Kalanchoe fedtschenkoi TaxID=63787 RepID=A0A7N0T500_KALFE
MNAQNPKRPAEMNEHLGETKYFNLSIIMQHKLPKDDLFNHTKSISCKTNKLLLKISKLCYSASSDSCNSF